MRQRVRRAASAVLWKMKKRKHPNKQAKNTFDPWSVGVYNFTVYTRFRAGLQRKFLSPGASLRYHAGCAVQLTATTRATQCMSCSLSAAPLLHQVQELRLLRQPRTYANFVKIADTSLYLASTSDIIKSYG